MPLIEAQLRWVRSHVGEAPPSDDDLNEAFDRLGAVELVVEETLALRLANMLKNPASFSVSGKYSQNTSTNIRALQEQLDKFREKYIDGAPGARVLPAPLPRGPGGRLFPYKHGRPEILR